MKKHLLAAAFAMAILPSMAQVKPDAVLMTVDGRPVTVGEFEYLYNKNKAQQTNPQSLEEYLVMFENYKLKVADALNAGIDKTQNFLSEYNSFRNELAAPYLRDKVTEEALIQEAYNHRKNDVMVSHIMVEDTPAEYAKLDSVRNEIVNGNVTFEDAARKYSVDRNSSVRGGLMGYVIPDRFPWAFEKAAYDTKPGEISPVINSGMGYHIIRVESVAPSLGDIEASHILLMTRGMSPADQEAAKQRIDSLYNALQSGVDFADLAKRYSQDPGSAAKGGSLGRFSHGMMVAQFDSAAYATPEGQFSKPFHSAFGYHIVKTDKRYGIPELNDDLRKSITAAMGRDDRSKAPEKAYIKEFRNRMKTRIDDKTLDRIKAQIAANGGVCDSTIIAGLKNNYHNIATFDGGNVTVHDAMAYLPMAVDMDGEAFMANFNEAVDNAINAALSEAARDRLANINTDYRNLINEYRDGILLYEISNQKVWDKATKDTDGLKKFFEANRDKYRWDKPHFKSYVFFAKSDSLLNLAVAYADSLDTTDPAKFTQDMRKRFGRDIKVERVIAAQGENAITDYLAFNGSKEAADKQSKWPAYAAWHGRLLQQPEDAADVRGAAVTDYQAYLEKQWLDELHKKYKIKVNEKIFKQLPR